MTELKTVTTCFKNPALNKLGGELIDLYQKSVDDIAIAQDKLRSSIERRFLAGKYLSENLEMIKDECGSQRAFGEQIGLSEGTLSNDKRAYEALVTEGITEVKDLIPYLQKKNIQANTFSWERMPKMLNEPDAYREKDRRPKDERRLEELEKEYDEIRQRNESGSHNYIAQAASDALQEIKELKEHFNKLEPITYQWEKQSYRTWACSLGWDFITDEPCEITEFHHTDLKGGSGGEGKKLPDVFGLPVSPTLHRKIEEGKYKPTSMQIASGLIKLQSLFILNHWK